MTDHSHFPDPTYRDTVLAPLFDGVKTHYAGPMDAINQAHLVMLCETGILTAKDAGSIARALADITAETDIETLAYTGAVEDYFFHIEAALLARLGDLGGALHTARSRNDMDHTMFRMALLDRSAALMQTAQTLARALLAKAEAEAETLIVAYTHGQPAQPSTFGHYLAGVIETLLRDCARLEEATALVDACPMGAAAITTSGFPIDRARMADLLGFRAPLLNSYGCIAGVDYITGLYSALKLVCLHLGRVIQDMAFWSAFEVGQLHVPDSLVQISSIMPQKRNPVPIEHMRHLASVASGQCDMVINTMHNTPFTDMNDSEGAVQQAGYGAFETADRMLRLLAAFLPVCQINPAAVARNGDAACVTITELADSLVRADGLSFRQAHHIAAATARAVIAAEKPLDQGFGPFQDAYRAATTTAPAMTEPEFQRIVSPRNFVALRDRPGGPAPGALATAFATYRTEIARLDAAGRARQTRRQDADTARNAAFNALKRI